MLKHVFCIVFLSFILQAVYADGTENRITILYDSFAKNKEMKTDWGFSAYIEFNNKKILFDAGNDSAFFQHNVEAAGIDLAGIDYAVISHRHDDHIKGLSYLFSVNPNVPVYVPNDKFGIFSKHKQNQSAMKASWQQANFIPVTQKNRNI